MIPSFYNTPTNMIKSWYPCSLQRLPFLLLFPFTAHPVWPPALCQHPRCSDHTWDPLTDPFQDFCGKMKTHLSLVCETGSSASQNIVSVELVGVIPLSGVHVFTCIIIKSGRRSNASDHRTVLKEGKWNLPAAYLSQEMKRVSSCSTQGQVC